MLKGYFERTLVPGRDCAWDFDPVDFTPGDPAPAAPNGLIPRLINVRRMLGVSTYGSPRAATFLAGDNGRNAIGTAIRSSFSSDCTCKWLGLYSMDTASQADRIHFLQSVERAVAEL